VVVVVDGFFFDVVWVVLDLVEWVIGVECWVGEVCC